MKSMKMTVELSEEEVRLAIIYYLQQQGYEVYEVKNVKLEVGNVSSGYGPTETTRPGFKCARCEVTK